MKLYFSEDCPLFDGFCRSESSWLEIMKEYGFEEMTLIEAKRETGSGYFFCKEFQEIGESGEGCGRICPEYYPNNGKNGRCKHYGYVYEQTEIKKVLTLKQKNEKDTGSLR